MFSTPYLFLLWTPLDMNEASRLRIAYGERIKLYQGKNVPG